MPTHAVILAAGKGTRMHSALPKVLHRIGGKPLLGHVINVAKTLAKTTVHIVTGHGAEQVRHYFSADKSLHWVTQEPQLGTGHALAQAMPNIPLSDSQLVLVLCGDVPMIREATLLDLLANANKDTLALLTLITETPTGFGRILRDKKGEVTAIVEEKDADASQRQIKEINSGIMAIPAAKLSSWLGRLENNNKQGEYYLTDVIALAVTDRTRIYTKVTHDPFEVQGINDREQLATLERYYQMNKASELMKAGVTLADPARIDIRGEVSHGRDVEIDVNVILEGTVSLGDNSSIGPNVYIKDSTVGSGVTILANCHIEGASIGDDCSIGPFARLRPGTELKDGVKIGNFVETKNSSIGKNSKASHFAYIGDADIGAEVNVGAGTIFCNYDGANKHRTIVEDGVFIGSNSTLVAPLKLAANAFVAAGSTINADVPPGSLAVGRGKQRNIDGWKKPVKKK
jgi:bifunctional UDP-N-acetylglucosamine pyrophosphorylase / glucosamine-1-phosphate N-acetyltransferase